MREWAIGEEDFQLLLFYLREIDEILDKMRMRDVKIKEMKKILDGARLRDPKFKKGGG